MSKMTNLGPHGIDLSAPGGIDALLAFHRATFGDARMEAADDGGTAAQAAIDSAATATGEPALNEHGFPDKTPWRDMPPEQQAAYWQHQAKKHEARANSTKDYDAIKNERDALKSQTLTADEKALEDAANTAREAGATEERNKLAPRLVTAEFKAVVAGRIPADTLAAILEPLDTTKFLAADGEVDTDKVKQYVAGIVPAGGKWPDTGQGHRQSSKASGVGAGRDLFVERHPKK